MAARSKTWVFILPLAGISKATNAHTEYVILITLRWQLVVAQTYVACPVFGVFDSSDFVSSFTRFV